MYVDMNGSDFEKLVSTLVGKIGYSLDMVKQQKTHLDVEAKTTDALGVTTTLLRVVKQKKTVKAEEVKQLYKDMKSRKFSKAVLIALSRFSPECYRLVENKPIKLIDGSEFNQLLGEHGLMPQEKERARTIYESAFVQGKNPERARSYFEKKAGKNYLRLFGSREKVVSVDGKYAPVASFEITRVEHREIGTLLKKIKTREKTNVFYVNLNNLETYYVEKSALGGELTVKTSDALKRVLGLSPRAVEIFADITKFGYASYRYLDKKFMLFLEENLEHLLMLENRGLIAVRPGHEYGFMVNVSIPEFESPKYNLKNSFEVEKSIDTDCKPDAINYLPEDVLELLRAFFAGTGKFIEIVYMPYYLCRYVDERGMSRSETLLTPKTKNGR